jgi:Uncharacterised nucleotidyltransferase
MDSKDASTKVDQTYRLLSLCARAQGHPAFYAELKQQIRVFTAWDELPARAEANGMSCLLLHHVQNAGISLPQETERTLKALTLRCRRYNQIHERVLTEILSLFEQAGIQPLLLKGLALAYLYYPEPALRPVSDIDLLLKKKDFPSALSVLKGTKFDLQHPLSASKRLPKSLTAHARQDGINIQVELHHYDPKVKYEKGNNPDPEFAGLDSQSQALKINGGIVYTSGPLETLLYLIRHLTKHLFTANSNKPVQIKWIADIVSLVERHAGELDWRYLQQHHPDVINRLEVFYSLTPLPERFAKIIPVQQVPIPGGVNRYPPGWPHQSIQQWKDTGYLRFILLAFVPPSDWWIRLYYGVEERSLFWYKQFIYRIQILTAMFWVIVHKMEL